MLSPATTRDDAGDDGQRRRGRPSARRPCSASRRTSRGRRRGPRAPCRRRRRPTRTSAGRPALMKPVVAGAERLQLARARRPRPGPVGRRCVEPALGLDLGVARRPGRRRCRPCAPAEQAARLLAEGDEPARREVEHRRRQRPSRGRAVHDHRARRGGQVGRWRRHQDRRVVEVDRVLAEAPPVEERPAGQAEEDDRGADQAEDRVDLAGPLERRRRARASPPRRPSRARPPARRRSRPTAR